MNALSSQPPSASPADDSRARHAAGETGVVPTDARDTIHAVIAESEGWYVAECLEAAVVTQGRSLDELMANLRIALEMYFDGEDLACCGLSSTPRLSVTYRTFAFPIQCPS